MHRVLALVVNIVLICASGGTADLDAEALAEAAEAMEALLPEAHLISWDGDSTFIEDGGGDMYDDGNKMMTNLCPSSLLEYSDSFSAVESECFGGAPYRMWRGESLASVCRGAYGFVCLKTTLFT